MPIFCFHIIKKILNIINFILLLKLILFSFLLQLLQLFLNLIFNRKFIFQTTSKDILQPL